jgi:hypothetical protein
MLESAAIAIMQKVGLAVLVFLGIKRIIIDKKKGPDKLAPFTYVQESVRNR